MQYGTVLSSTESQLKVITDVSTFKPTPHNQNYTFLKSPLRLDPIFCKSKMGPYIAFTGRTLMQILFRTQISNIYAQNPNIIDIFDIFVQDPNIIDIFDIFAQDPNAPKRPMSAYFLFMNATRATVSLTLLLIRTPSSR